MLGDLGVPPVESVAGILSQAPVLPRTCARPRTLPAQRLNRPPAVLPNADSRLRVLASPHPEGTPGCGRTHGRRTAGRAQTLISRINQGAGRQ